MEAAKILDRSREGFLGVWGAERIEDGGGERRHRRGLPRAAGRRNADRRSAATPTHRGSPAAAAANRPDPRIPAAGKGWPGGAGCPNMGRPIIRIKGRLPTPAGVLFRSVKPRRRGRDGHLRPSRRRCVNRTTTCPARWARWLEAHPATGGETRRMWYALGGHRQEGRRCGVASGAALGRWRRAVAD
jgi:hypothetical protein